MKSILYAISSELLSRLLAHAPEPLQQEAQRTARRMISAFCFTEEEIRLKFREWEEWDEFSDEAQRQAITSLLDADEYTPARRAADDSIDEAVCRYIHDSILEKQSFEEGSSEE